jgi:hypothetical protein
MFWPMEINGCGVGQKPIELLSTQPSWSTGKIKVVMFHITMFCSTTDYIYGDGPMRLKLPRNIIASEFF